MELNKYIDHTLLKQGATLSDIEKLCSEAKENNFAAVCIAPSYVSYAKQLLKNTDVKVCTVIGFPFGYNTVEAKIAEVISALTEGADEIDIVQNVSYVKNNEWGLLDEEIWDILQAIEGSIFNWPVIKIILETGLLTEAEIKKCCQIYSKYDEAIDFMKTSTGYAAEPFSGEEFKQHKIRTVELIKESCNDSMQIKASGGIKDLTFAEKLIEAGATRLGCSAGVQIIKESQGVKIDTINTGNY